MAKSLVVFIILLIVPVFISGCSPVEPKSVEPDKVERDKIRPFQAEPDEPEPNEVEPAGFEPNSVEPVKSYPQSFSPRVSDADPRTLRWQDDVDPSAEADAAVASGLEKPGTTWAVRVPLLSLSW